MNFNIGISHTCLGHITLKLIYKLQCWSESSNLTELPTFLCTNFGKLRHKSALSFPVALGYVSTEKTGLWRCKIMNIPIAAVTLLLNLLSCNLPPSTPFSCSCLAIPEHTSHRNPHSLAWSPLGWIVSCNGLQWCCAYRFCFVFQFSSSIDSFTCFFYTPHVFPTHIHPVKA